MDIAKVCFVCEKDLKSSATILVKKKAIESFVRSSLARKDDKHKLLSNLSSVTLHELCKNTYNQESQISAAVKALDSPGTSRSRGSTFDFKNKCFLCDNDASEQYLKQENKKSANKRDLVSNVSTTAFRSTLLKRGEERNDDWGRTVVQRITNIIDLVAAEGKYHRSCLREFQRSPACGSVGRPKDSNTAQVINFISTHLEEHRDECQFSLRDILRTYEGELPSEKWIKEKLLERYNEEIIITSNARKEPTICFRSVGHQILPDAFYDKRHKDPQQERLKIVREAGHVIIEDIRSKLYETNTYPSPPDFLNNVNTDVPDTLRVLLETIILKNKKGDPEEWTPKILSIAHAIIAAVRPKSFISSLQLGLAAVLNRKFGSRVLLDILAALGFSASYSDAVLFETSAIMHPQKHIMSDAFIQFAYDKADHSTINGSNKFHAMGGIECVTQSASMVTAGPIPRLKQLPKAMPLGSFGTVPLKNYDQQGKIGLSAVPIKNLHQLNPIESKIKLLPSDFIWLYGTWKVETGLPGWNGFLEQITSHLECSRSSIISLPFINASPSKNDTIYTALLEASNKCIEQGQKVCFVTFDQPLYWKAREIVASGALNSDYCYTIIRLGGYHLLMSFLDAIGYIMSGSGLKELFSIAYAPSSVDKMLKGHAYGKAVRAHQLVHLALAKIILSKTDFNDDDREMMENIFLTPELILENSEGPVIAAIMKKFTQTLNQLESHGSTAKLWSQYFNMVTLVKQFIQAERMGDWSLHLKSIQQMLPFFHASGHFLYAKSCQLYLQDMLELRSILSPEDYDKFVTQGFFTVRRSEKFGSGIWTDMSIEQTLMKDSKSLGLTRGQGITDSVLGKCVLGMPTMIEVTEKIASFCNLDFSTADQHVDAKPSRMKRNNEDAQKFVDWFSSHPPFPETVELLSLSTGVRGTESINCHKAEAIGLSAMKSIVGKTFGDVKLRRKTRVQSIANVTSSIKVNDENVAVDPALLFQRISLVKKSEAQLKAYLQYELSPYPVSIFTDTGMRKTTKSKFYECFDPSTIQLPDDLIHVVDGGYLLHSVEWQERETFEGIINRYVDYVEKSFKPNSIIVFDGYPDDALLSSTKHVERTRRQSTNTDIIFDSTTTATTSQETFLSNDSNKNRLIQMLMNKLRQANFLCRQAYEDADTLIVTTALEVAKDHPAVVIVGEDIDLLVIMTALSPENSNVYFLKPSIDKVEGKLYTNRSFRYPSIQNYILFLHAFSGCDTTSAFFGLGKSKFVKMLNGDKDLQIVLSPFLSDDSHPVYLDFGAQRFITALYGGKNNEPVNLDELRFTCFAQSTNKEAFNLCSLPPTRRAAREHAFRVYHQIQTWKGNSLLPIDWGWKRTPNGLEPITTSKPAAPEELLKIISCKCAKGCAGNCGCRKVGLRCSMICVNCQGRTCTNVDCEVDIDEDVDDPIDIDLENFLAEDMVIEDEASDGEDINGVDVTHSPPTKRQRTMN